jgi:hypothetical protein
MRVGSAGVSFSPELQVSCLARHVAIQSRMRDDDLSIEIRAGTSRAGPNAVLSLFPRAVSESSELTKHLSSNLQGHSTEVGPWGCHFRRSIRPPGDSLAAK